MEQSYSDSELYKKHLSGSAWAFDELIRRYDESLTHYLYGILHDYHDAEDMMVEAFARILQKLPRIGEGCFKAYLFRTGRNLAINFLKHSRRYEEFSVDGLEPEASADVTPEGQNAAREQKAVLYRCLGRMDALPREALYLVYLDGLSYKEAAAVMKVSAKKIDNLLSRGRVLMREELEKEGYDRTDR